MVGGIKVNCVILVEENINSSVQFIIQYGFNGPWCSMSEKGKRIQSPTHYLAYTFTTIAANTRNHGISSNAVNRIWPKSSSFTKINQELVYLSNQFTHAHMFFFYDIFINSSCVINVACFYMLSLPKVNIHFVKYFLIDAQLADFFHYDVAKLN